MREFTQHKNQILSLAIVWAVVHSLLFWRFGVRNMFDSAVYVRGADFLIEHGRFGDFYHLFYAVYIILLALFFWVFTYQLLPSLVLQCMVSGLAAVA